MSQFLTEIRFPFGSGVSYSAVHGFAVGIQNVTLQTASRIAQVLGVLFSSRKLR